MWTPSTPTPRSLVTDDLITALIPVKAYQPSYLRQAVGSLLEQTSPNWRALIIHTRGARAEIETVLDGAARDGRIMLTEQRGRKLAGALNTGMRASDTEYAAILLGDDLWAPNAVEVLNRNIVAAPDVDFFHSARRFIDDDGAAISSVHQAPSEVTREMFFEGGPVKHLLCWRIGFALSIGGMDESLNSVGPDDYDFPWSMLDAGARFSAVPECLYIYRDHRSGHRLTTHLPLTTHVNEIRRILRKHGAPEDAIASHIAQARASYLRHCLYSSRLDAWWGRLRRRDPARGWRDEYS